MFLGLKLDLAFHIVFLGWKLELPFLGGRTGSWEMRCRLFLMEMRKTQACLWRGVENAIACLLAARVQRLPAAVIS
jgi:hypothetical protein